MSANNGLVTTDRIGEVPINPPHVLDAAARYVCRHVPDADGVQTVLAALGLQET